MSALSILTSLGLTGPIYLRKLPRKNCLGDQLAPLEERAAEVAEAVFLSDPNPYSLFRIENDQDLQRIAIGYNGGRASLTSDLDWWPITAADFAQIAVVPDQTPGHTVCHFANDRHFDLPANPDQIRQLCRTLLEGERKVLSLRKKELKPWVEQATTHSCLAVKVSVQCLLIECERATPSPPEQPSESAPT